MNMLRSACWVFLMASLGCSQSHSGLAAHPDEDDGTISEPTGGAGSQGGAPEGSGGTAGAGDAPRGGGDGDGGNAGEPSTDSTGGNTVEESLPDAAPPVDESLPRRSPGCGKMRAGTSSFVRHTMTIAGVERSHFLWVPRNYDPMRAYPLLFTWHGAYGPDRDPALPGANAIAEGTKSDAIVVAPNGVKQPTVSNTSGWDLSPNSADLLFFDALRRSLMDEYCIDGQRVLSHGFSMGGAFSLLLGCARGDVIRGIAVINGAFRAPTVTPPASTCKGHAAAWVVQGARDTTVTPAIATQARETLYLPRHGCTTTDKPVAPSPCVGFDGCMAGYPQVLCTTNAGHDPQNGFSVPGAWSFLSSLADVAVP